MSDMSLIDSYPGLLFCRLHVSAFILLLFIWTFTLFSICSLREGIVFALSVVL